MESMNRVRGCACVYRHISFKLLWVYGLYMLNTEEDQLKQIASRQCVA